MSCTIVVVVLTFMLVSPTFSQEISCPGSLEALITGEKFRVEDYQITASSSFSNEYLPREARLGRNSWCSQNGQEENSWLQVDFGADVVIHELRIGGTETFLGLRDHHLQQFLVEFGPNSTHLSTIFLPNSMQVMTFTREDTPDVRTTVLPAPITTRVLRIRTVTYEGTEPCVVLEANGCIHSPACALNESLSSNRTLLPLSSITASSATSEDPAEGVVDNSQAGWCSTQQFDGDQPTPYIVFNFTERVALTYMRARGQSSRYVEEFSLDYRDQYSDNYTSYTLLTDDEAVFTSVDDNLQTYTFWRQPLQGVTFRFKIRDGVRSSEQFCWSVTLYGCTAEEPGDVSVIPTTSVRPSVTTQLMPATSTGNVATPTVDIATPMTTPMLVTTPTQITLGNTGASIGAIAGGAAGGAVVLLILLFLVVLLVGCLLVTRRSRETRLTGEVAYTKTGSVRIVDNDLYGLETPPSSPTAASEGFGIPSEPQSNTYESLKSPATKAIDLANSSYESIPSPKVKATSFGDAETYEPVGSPLVYSYTTVDMPVKVRLPGDTKPQEISEKINLMSEEEGLEESSAPVTMELSSGSMIENSLYEGAGHIERKTLADNPMYGEVHPEVSEPERGLVANPLYDTQ